MQGQTFDLASRAIGLEFHKIGAAIANLSDDRSTLVFEPRGGASSLPHTVPSILPAPVQERRTSG
jgi:hypothetical protein